MRVAGTRFRGARRYGESAMELKLARKTYTANSTIGMLFVDGQFECYTLEDVVRPTKIYGETAIPTGRYKLVVTWSPAFKRLLPLLVDVPGYSGVRIHTGNDKTNTLGCVLVGLDKLTDRIGRSKLAFDALMPKIQAATAREEVFIEISDQPEGALAATRSRGGKVRPMGLPPAQLGSPWMPPGMRLVVRAAPPVAKKTARKTAKLAAKPAAKKVPAKSAVRKAAPARKRATS
jgi:hypothetical protein